MKQKLIETFKKLGFKHEEIYSGYETFVYIFDDRVRFSIEILGTKFRVCLQSVITCDCVFSKNWNFLNNNESDIDNIVKFFNICKLMYEGGNNGNKGTM